jgi:hypothetical protein
MPKFKIRPVVLSNNQLIAASSDTSPLTGFTTHGTITKAFNIHGGHTDPGVAFPIEFFMSLIRCRL